MKSFTVGSFVSGFFHLACFQDSPMLRPVSILNSFLWLCDTPLCDYVTFYLFIISGQPVEYFLLFGYFEQCC